MMFLICGVVKPEFDVTGMISRGDDYATLASAAGATFGATDSAISIVAAHNDGPGVGMFEFTTGNLANHFAQPMQPKIPPVPTKLQPWKRVLRRTS